MPSLALGICSSAELVNAQRFNRITTTNFDDLANDALTRFYDLKPLVCSFDSAVLGIRIGALRPKIVKLHGDFLFDNMRNVKSELKSLSENMEEKMLKCVRNRPSLVDVRRRRNRLWGRSQMLRKKEYLNYGLHWCIRDTGNEDFSTPEAIQAQLPPRLRIDAEL